MKILTQLFLIGAMLLVEDANAQYELFKNHKDTFKYKDCYVVEEEIVISSNNVADSFGLDLTKFKSYYYNNVLKEEYSKRLDFMIGEYRSYYPSGALNTVYTCEKGDKVDFYMELYENGKRKVIGRYIITENSPQGKYQQDTTLLLINGADSVNRITTTILTNDIKNGNWYYWDSTGNLIKKELWEKGNLIK